MEGKTTLASFIIEKLQESKQGPVVYFYCKHNQPEKRTLNSIVRGLLTQLVKIDDDLLAYIYDECASVDETKLDSTSTLEELLGLAFASQNTTFVVLDGIDECGRDEETEIVNWFQSIILQSNSHGPVGVIRLLCISQRDGNLDRLLAKAPSVSLENKEHQGDIEAYTRQNAGKIRENFDITLDEERSIAQNVAKTAAG